MITPVAAVQQASNGHSRVQAAADGAGFVAARAAKDAAAAAAAAVAKDGCRTPPPVSASAAAARTPPRIELEEDTIRVKDPVAKGHVVYDVPLSHVSMTNGLRDVQHQRERNWCSAASTVSSGSNGEGSESSHGVSTTPNNHPLSSCSSSAATTPPSSNHRSCVCKLFLEHRCGQGAKCKSIHVDPAYIAAVRKQKGIEYDNTFLSEIVVEHPEAERGLVFAIRYTAACKTVGLDKYKQDRDLTKPALLCQRYNPIEELLGQHARGYEQSARQRGKASSDLPGIGYCPLERSCPYIHAKATELRDVWDNKQRTPCCVDHADVGTPHAPLCLRIGSEAEVVVPYTSVAPTNGLHKLLQRAEKNRKGGGGGSAHGITVALDSVCFNHGRSRCKFGRSCVKLHICREVQRKSILSHAEANDESGPAPPQYRQQDAQHRNAGYDNQAPSFAKRKTARSSAQQHQGHVPAAAGAAATPPSLYNTQVPMPMPMLDYGMMMQPMHDMMQYQQAMAAPHAKVARPMPPALCDAYPMKPHFGLSVDLRGMPRPATDDGGLIRPVAPVKFEEPAAAAAAETHGFAREASEDTRKLADIMSDLQFALGNGGALAPVSEMRESDFLTPGHAKESESFDLPDWDPDTSF
eukprot:Rhum_TRINITY_DN14767_c11_g1::Rhum_TRINITY_DN14767_c11_g1_i1::g.116823::m.116823